MSTRLEPHAGAPDQKRGRTGLVDRQPIDEADGVEDHDAADRGVEYLHVVKRHARAVLRGDAVFKLRGIPAREALKENSFGSGDLDATHHGRCGVFAPDRDAVALEIDVFLT